MAKAFTMLTSKQQHWTVTGAELEQSSNSSTTSKRSWLSKLSSMVRPRKSSERRSPSPMSSVDIAAPHDPSRAAVTASWVNANARANAAPHSNAWRSEVTLHPSSHYHPQNVVMYQPPETYVLPAGPTALTPSPYVTGTVSQRRPRAHTTSATTHDTVAVNPYSAPAVPPMPSPTLSYESYAPAPARVLPPRVPPPLSLPPVASRASYGAHMVTPTRMRSKSRHTRSSSSVTQMPSPPQTATFGGVAWDGESQQHAFARSIHSVKSSPALTVSDVLSSWQQNSDPPSAWVMSDSRASKRSSASSTMTFGV